MNYESVLPNGDRRIVRLILAGVLLVVGAVSCGQTSNQIEGQPEASAPADNVDPISAFKAYAQCMRDQGIANYPDPTENGINLNGTGIDHKSPEFRAAAEACSALLPQPPQGPRGESGRNGPGEARRPGGEPNRPAGSGVRTEWTKIEAGAECKCADGSGFAYWDHKGDPTKVVLYLDGGGVCFDPVSCAAQNTPTSGEREGPDYDPNIAGEFPDGGGLLDLGRADNPFHGYSFIYVPLCTADAYIGNITREYAPGLTVAHNGFINGTSALNYLADHYAGAAQVVVLGKSAGGSAAPLYAGLLSDRLPNARIIAIAAQAASFPDDPGLNAMIGEGWGAFSIMPDWKVNKGLTVRDWSTRRFAIQAGLHNPKIVMARFDYAFDPHAVQTLEYLKVPGIDPANTLAIIDANEAAVEAAGVTLHSYTAPGEGHGILEFELAYDMDVNGVKLTDWIKALLDGKPLGDVHCNPCKE